ncbi:MAG: hypothetical protein VB089_00100, partial [Anaerolineaceae bacterium]|nr:hypothetical protein [Anaerolineaceae bacterium]
GRAGPGVSGPEAPFLPARPPALPELLVERPRLVRRMCTPVMLIYAPGGFGKTTLVNQWRQACGFPVVWVSLRPEDNQPLRFWSTLAAALAATPGLGVTPPPGATPGDEGGPPCLPAAAGPGLLDYLAGARAGLVLDDFHHIHHPRLHAALQAWLDRAPDGLRLVIAGRTQPALALGGLRARGLLTELDADDLRFTPAESRDFLRRHVPGAPLDPADVETLARRTGGWAAGLNLAALGLSKPAGRRQFMASFDGTHHYLREYFTETILRRQPPRVQAFLLRTALLKQLNGPLCDALTGYDDGQALLLRLWKDNLFITRFEDGDWYGYDELFSEMLRDQLRRQFPGEIPGLHRRAADWYRRNHILDEAVYHLLAAGAWEEAAGLLEEVALWELEQCGQDSRLLRWLQALPESVVQQHKTLLFVYLQLAQLALSEQEIEGFIRRIEANLAAAPPETYSADEGAVLEEIRRIRRTWTPGSAFALPAQASGPHAARWAALNGLYLLKHVYGPHPPGLERQIAGLRRQGQAQHNRFVILLAGGSLARWWLAQGSLRRSARVARQVLAQAAGPDGRLPEPASIPLAVLSQVYFERDELDLAESYLARARQVDPDPASTNMPLQIAVQQAALQAARGEAQAARATLQAARALHARRPSRVWRQQDLLAYEARLCLRMGDYAAAEELLAQA